MSMGFIKHVVWGSGWLFYIFKIRVPWQLYFLCTQYYFIIMLCTIFLVRFCIWLKTLKSLKDIVCIQMIH